MAYIFLGQNYPHNHIVMQTILILLSAWHSRLPHLRISCSREPFFTSHIWPNSYLNIEIQVKNIFAKENIKTKKMRRKKYKTNVEITSQMDLILDLIPFHLVNMFFFTRISIVRWLLIKKKKKVLMGGKYVNEGDNLIRQVTSYVQRCHNVDNFVKKLCDIPYCVISLSFFIISSNQNLRIFVIKAQQNIYSSFANMRWCGNTIVRVKQKLHWT